MSKVKELLVATRKLLDDPKKWTQGEFARDKEGHSVSPLSPEATCFCLVGALRKEKTDWDSYIVARSHIRTLLSRNVTGFNDFATHKDVINVLDKAIERA